MEKEVLFTEEVEPPGQPAGGVRRYEARFLSPDSNQLSSSGSSSQLSLVEPSRWTQRCVVSERSKWFRKSFFPQASLSDWNDWRWQLSNRILKPHQLERILKLSPEEKEGLMGAGGSLPMAITPYYASLLDPQDPAHALRRTVVPTMWERKHSPGEAEDPLEEDRDSPVSGLVHRYPDRVLFLVTGFCSTYCRYCTRSRMVGHSGLNGLEREQLERAISYIQQTHTIRDVLLSGGDALTLPDEVLDWLLGRLYRIPHVEFLRLGTKVPVVLPQRITPSLLRVLRKFHPLWISIHFTHPEELTPEVAQACQRLADAGLPLGSQTVLLKGVNDELGTMRKLFHGLLRFRVKPYYLYQCDPIVGSAHFRTPVSRGLEIIAGLRGHTTGYAVPTYVIDAPGGGGKIPLLPEYLVGRNGDDLLLRNYQGQLYRYPDPLPGNEKAACDLPSLLQEP